LLAGELELLNELESLSAALEEFDVVEPVPDDGDITEITRQLELCVVRVGMNYSLDLYLSLLRIPHFVVST